MRGGSILEKFSMVDAVVFDKTGTLTKGKPVVTKVITIGSLKNANVQLSVTLISPYHHVTSALFFIFYHKIRVCRTTFSLL